MQLKKIGRPSIEFDTIIADEILNCIATSSKGLQKLCKENPKWPSKPTIYEWLKKNPDFSNSYARAKEFQIQAIIDEIMDIADDSSGDRIVDAEGKIFIDHARIQRDRLRIDSRKWLAAKLCPRLYGDRINHEADLNIITHEKAILELDN